MKNVVLLAPYFLPRRRVGSWRPFKFAIHLRDFGWQPHVITIHEPKETLTTKEARLLSDIPVHEIKSPFDLTHKIGRQLEFNGRFTGSGTTHSSSDSSTSRLKMILDGIDRHFPIDTWLPLFFLRKKKIEHFIESINPDVLWSTGDPWSSHWLAHKLTEKYQLPWVADFRDPWTLGDIQLKNRSGLAHQIDQQQEAKVIRQASVLTFTSPETEKLYRRQYTSRIKKSATIPNSFDSTLFNAPESKEHYFDDNYLNLIFFGRFRPLSPAQPLIKLLRKVYQQAPALAQKIRVYSFGSLSSNDRDRAKVKGVYKNFIILKPVALENGLSILTQADILWLSTHPHRQNIIPAKLWDYIAAKRPILSVAPNSEIGEILQETGTGLHFDGKNNSALVEILCQSVRAKIDKKPLPIPVSFDDKAIKQYDADIATQKLADIFDFFT